MTVLIDNYDSFSYNLYQLLGTITQDIMVIRNDAISVEELEALQPNAIILSPGPGRPEDAGICEETVLKLGGKIPILGVCLGHQAICQSYGGTITYARELMHGKQSKTTLDYKCPIFKNCPETVLVARYHSLAVGEDTLPACLQITARTINGEIMAVQHREYEVYGLQFHPESIMTPEGRIILQNFMNRVIEREAVL